MTLELLDLTDAITIYLGQFSSVYKDDLVVLRLLDGTD